jgi:hypothetical protein
VQIYCNFISVSPLRSTEHPITGLVGAALGDGRILGYSPRKFSSKDEGEWRLDLVLSLRLQDLRVVNLFWLGHVINAMLILTSKKLRPALYTSTRT